ncbi:MAG: phosphopantetheine-binding protein [Ruminococcus flavefaciens]|nr:phosphopantetheine-binding protein [Ruminococcus flavefaciens]
MITWELFEILIRKNIPDRKMAETVKINRDTSLFQDLKYDSLAIVELLTNIEEQFGIDFTEQPDFMEKMERCGDFYQGICEAKEEKL